MNKSPMAIRLELEADINARLAAEKSPAARIALVAGLLYPVDEEGRPLPPLISMDEARALLDLAPAESRTGGGDAGAGADEQQADGVLHRAPDRG